MAVEIRRMGREGGLINRVGSVENVEGRLGGRGSSNGRGGSPLPPARYRTRARHPPERSVTGVSRPGALFALRNKRNYSIISRSLLRAKEV